YLSMGTSVVLLIIYVLFLFFQLKTHAYLYNEGASPSATQEEVEEVEEVEEAVIGAWAAGATLVVVTIAIAVCSEYLVESIDEVVKSSGISKTFIGLILLPIVGNAGQTLSPLD